MQRKTQSPCLPPPYLRRGDTKLGQAADALLLIVLARDPDLLLVLDNLGEHGAAQEHHVLAARRVLDAHFELGQLASVVLCACRRQRIEK